MGERSGEKAKEIVEITEIQNSEEEEERNLHLKSKYTSVKNFGEKGLYIRADKLDLSNLDQLDRHLSIAWSLERAQKPKEKWEIDASKLEIGNVIARGTYGIVYRGVYDGEDVAVKILDWEEDKIITSAAMVAFRASFHQEVSVWSKLDHPNITKFIGASMGIGDDLRVSSKIESNAVYCVVLEYLPGGTLKNYLIKHRIKKLAYKVVIELALDLARGLTYLHSKKIVHRDVKTENMLLDIHRKLKIADFGVARVEAQNPRNMTGETGTLGYMAPEVLNGKPYNRKCDVYSFGICLWEIYCCDVPFQKLSFSTTMQGVANQHLRPSIPRCCPRIFANIMKRCWDENPDKRPEMSEVVELLEAIDTSRGGGMIPEDEVNLCVCFRKPRGP